MYITDRNTLHMEMQANCTMIYWAEIQQQNNVSLCDKSMQSNNASLCDESMQSNNAYLCDKSMQSNMQFIQYDVLSYYF